MKSIELRPKCSRMLLEVMQEHQVTIGRRIPSSSKSRFSSWLRRTRSNRYGILRPLPEAQVDRFMLKVVVGYPSTSEERKVVDVALDGLQREVRPVLTPDVLGCDEADRRFHLPG